MKKLLLVLVLPLLVATHHVSTTTPPERKTLRQIPDIRYDDDVDSRGCGIWAKEPRKDGPVLVEATVSVACERRQRYINVVSSLWVKVPGDRQPCASERRDFGTVDCWEKRVLSERWCFDSSWCRHTVERPHVGGCRAQYKTFGWGARQTLTGINYHLAPVDNNALLVYC